MEQSWLLKKIKIERKKGEGGKAMKLVEWGIREYRGL